MIDPLVIGLATVGLGLTAATVATLGATAPEKAGVSTLKAGGAAPAACRRCSPARWASWRPTPSTARGAAPGRGAPRSPAATLQHARGATGRGLPVRGAEPEAVATLKGLGTDVATIGGNAGYRTTVAALGTAKSTEEMGVIARLSSRFGTATRGALVLGSAAMTAASLDRGRRRTSVDAVAAAVGLAGVTFAGAGSGGGYRARGRGRRAAPRLRMA